MRGLHRSYGGAGAVSLDRHTVITRKGAEPWPFPALRHVAITVTDLDRSTRWYTALFGAAPVLDEDEEGGRYHHTVFALDGGTLIGLHTHQGRESGDPGE